ncbi:Uncharacterised protein [uncultured Clostridium sp.]|nr:Uncharacterised protein [uncultured Clostridium sp.]
MKTCKSCNINYMEHKTLRIDAKVVTEIFIKNMDIKITLENN